MVFVIHWYESAVDLHVFPILIPLPPPKLIFKILHSKYVDIAGIKRSAETLCFRTVLSNAVAISHCGSWSINKLTLNTTKCSGPQLHIATFQILSSHKWILATHLEPIGTQSPTGHVLYTAAYEMCGSLLPRRIKYIPSIKNTLLQKISASHHLSLQWSHDLFRLWMIWKTENC